MSDVKTYKFNDREYEQSYFTIRQTKQLKKLFDDLSIENFNPGQIVDALLESDKLGDALCILFKIDCSEKDQHDFDDLPIMTLVEIVDDFFSINDVQMIIGKVFSGILKVNQMIPNESIPLPNLSQAETTK